MIKKIIVLIALFFSFSIFSSEKIHLDHIDIDLKNQDSLQRGARNFINYCLNCHSANYMRYNRLQDIGLSETEIKNNLLFTAEKTGELMNISMDKVEAKKWFGANPPNLTVTSRSRGSDWIYTYLRSFYKDNSKIHGWNNLVFPNAAMPHILWELQGTQEFTDGHLKLTQAGKLSPQEYDQFVYDLVNYMTFMGEPAKLVRTKIGIFVLSFLVLLLVLVIQLKKEFWKDVK
jgi:ubiquinol-cytochrome c reductase cytochrome c1 subunit